MPKIEINTMSLQSLLDKANALPVAEDLTEVVAAQEAKLEELAAALDGQVTGSGSGGSAVETSTGTFSCDASINASYIIALVPVYQNDRLEYQECIFRSGGRTTSDIVIGLPIIIINPALITGLHTLSGAGYVIYNMQSNTVTISARDASFNIHLADKSQGYM